MTHSLFWEQLRQLADNVANSTSTIDEEAFFHNTSALQESNNSSSTMVEDEEEPIVNYQAGRAVLVLPRITAVISLCAVVCVAIEAWKDLRVLHAKNSSRIRSSTSTNNVSTITRIQFFYQIPLFCQALAFALGTTPAPRGMDIWGAVGSTATCEAQGFLMQFGIHGGVCWDVALSTAYLMMVRYHVADFHLQSWEKYYHIVVWPCVLAVCIYPLMKDMYNINHSVCWLESYPNECVGDDCIRGEGAPLWQTFTSFVGVLHLLYSIAVMICIYCSIRRMENRIGSSSVQSTSSDQCDTNIHSNANENGVQAQPKASPTFRDSATSVTNRRYSRAVGIQGMLYASGMILTTLPTALYIVLYNVTGIWSQGFGTFAISMTPLMGYVNFVIFMRGRSEADCRTSYGKFLRRAHSWIWDYKLLCRCQCQCLPKSTAPAASASATAPSTLPPPFTGRNSDEHAAVQVSAQQPHLNTKVTTLAAIDEEGGDDEEEGTEECQDDECQYGDADTRAPWTGCLISWKPKSLKASQCVSELAGSEFDMNDVSPSRPVRLRSEAELPPAKPVRAVSCLSELDDDLEDLEAGGSDSLMSRKNDVSPPTKPVRVQSSFETEDDNHSRLAESAGGAPPVKPVRYVSEVSEVDCSDSEEEL